MDANVMTRRTMPVALASLAAGLGTALSLVGRARAAEQAAGPGLSHDAESIHQEIAFAAKRERLYAALTTAEMFDKVSQLGRAARSMHLEKNPTQISSEAGGTFVLFGGYIVGRHLELVSGQRLVQAWREVVWDPGIFSIVKFELSDSGAGTKLVFDHTGFPKGAGPHLATGWYENYWGPLKKYLG